MNNLYTVSFLDANNEQVNMKIEFRIKGDRKEISFCNDYGQREFEPNTTSQQELLDMWNKYHLNGLHAGTKKQEETLKSCESTDYKEQCKFLEKKGLLFDNGYKYGSSWLYEELPCDIEKQVKEVIDKIRHEEAEFEKQKIEDYKELWFDLNNITQDTIDMINSEVSFNAEYGLALLEYLKKPFYAIYEMEDESPNVISLYGISYYVGTTDELEELAKDYLYEEDYLWREAVQAKQTELGLEDWIDSVLYSLTLEDGIANTLGAYDGKYHEATVNDELYLIIRRD